MKLRKTHTVYLENLEKEQRGGDKISRYYHTGGAWVIRTERVTNIFEADLGVGTSVEDAEKYTKILKANGYTLQNKITTGKGGKYYLHIDHMRNTFNFGYI